MCYIARVHVSYSKDRIAIVTYERPLGYDLRRLKNKEDYALQNLNMLVFLKYRHVKWTAAVVTFATM